jgi:GTP cyclohydrolase IB
MDLKDVQSSPDTRGISIQKVGVKKVHLPFQILTKQGGYQQVLAEVSLSTDLNHRYRGTHMSRLMELLNAWSARQVSSIEIQQLLKDVRKKLDTEHGEVFIKFKYFIEKLAPVTKTRGYMDYDCQFYGRVSGDEFTFILGVSVPVQLLCPCSKEISSEGAHNQRAIISVRVEYLPDSFIWLEDLVAGLETVGSSQLYPVIKREDEKFITENAFANPRFVEDALRNVVELLKKDERICWFEAECDSYESIHNHNAFAYQREFAEKEPGNID